MCYMQNNMNGNNCMPNNMMNNMNGMNNINQANNQQNMMNPMMMNPQMNPMMNGMMMNMMANIYGVAQMQNIMMYNIQKMQQDYINQQNQAIQTNNNNNGTNSFNTPNNNTTPNNNIITLIFVRTDKDKKEDFKITLLCTKSDTINQMIDKYCEKTFEKKENLLFLCNSANLGQYPNRTIDNAGLLNNSMIMVVNKKDMYGGILVK